MFPTLLGDGAYSIMGCQGVQHYGMYSYHAKRWYTRARCELSFGNEIEVPDTCTEALQGGEWRNHNMKTHGNILVLFSRDQTMSTEYRGHVNVAAAGDLRERLIFLKI